MFGMSIPEIAMVLILGLIVFGPKRIPQIARTLGKVMGEMRRAAAEVRRTIDVEDIRSELRLRNLERTQKEQRAPSGDDDEKQGDDPYEPAESTPVAAPVATETTSTKRRRSTRSMRTRPGTGDVLPHSEPGVRPSEVRPARTVSSKPANERAMEARLKAYLASTDANLAPALVRTVELRPARDIDRDGVRTASLPTRSDAEDRRVTPVELPARKT